VGGLVHRRENLPDKRKKCQTALYLSRTAVQRVYAQSFFLAQKSNQNTWFSATLDFSLVFRWFFKSKQLLGFLGVVYMLKQGPNENITFYLNIIKVEYSKEDIQTC
jgi:hypothetical protein